MIESDQPNRDTNSTSAKVPVSASIMAVISGAFVTFGIMLVMAFSHLFIGEWVSSAPKIVIAAIPYLAIGLGALTIWQTIQQAKRKAREQPK